MTSIIRGTTPTIIFEFSAMDGSDVTTGYMTIRKENDPVTTTPLLQLPRSSAVASDNQLKFTLTQEQTLAFPSGANIVVLLDWKTSGGVRGRSKRAVFFVEDPGYNEAM